MAACSPKNAPSPSTDQYTGGAGGGVAATTSDAGSSPQSDAGAGGAADASAAPHVFSIKFDYRFDTLGFFQAPERRAALEAAAAEWSSIIGNDFLPVPAGTKLRLNNPENRTEDVFVDSLEQDIDDVLIFVGTSEAIPGYGRGGPSTVAESSDGTLMQEFTNRQNGKFFQPWAGSISFKGSVNYFFDPTPETGDDVPQDQYDFISLATHEIGHVLGFTASPAFSALEAGSTFIGKSAVAAYGAPVPLTPDLGHGHLLDGTQSDGVECLMTPKLTNGIRQKPTTLDIAALQDIGYVLKR
jgi:hypothetical protein